VNEPDKTTEAAPDEQGVEESPPAKAEAEPAGEQPEAPAEQPTARAAEKGEGTEEKPKKGERKSAREKGSARRKKEPEEPPPPHPMEAPLKERFGDRLVGFEPVKGYCGAIVKADDLVEMCRELKEDSGYNYLRCITGIDRGGQLEVAYNVMNMETKEELILKVKLDPASPSVPTLCPLWKTADWQERETYDLLGIVFDGHPDHRRILLPDDWEGHPLRKDYEYRRD